MFTSPPYIVSIDKLIEDLPKIFTDKVRITISYQNMVKTNYVQNPLTLDSLDEWGLLVALADTYNRDNELIRPAILKIVGLCYTESNYRYCRDSVYELEMTSRKARMVSDITDTNINRFIDT